MITRSDFEPLLAKGDTTVTIHQCGFRTLAIEMHKISKNLSTPFMKYMMTEICALHNTRSATNAEKDDNEDHKFLKHSKYQLPVIKTVSLWVRIYQISRS